MELKKNMRSSIRRLKKQYTAQQLRLMSQSAAARLKQNEYVRRASVIMMYSSLPDEVCTDDIISELASQGKKILLPVVIDDENMALREYIGDDNLTAGAFDIKEPTGPLYDRLDTIDVAVVPGMMFDAAGRRLGRGKGYYDRFLKKIPRAHKIGICFDFQIAECVPSDDYDVVMDEVVF